MNVVERRVSLVTLTFEEIQEILYALKKVEDIEQHDDAMQKKLYGSFSQLLKELRYDYE